jgi:hypothetical protein
MAPTRKHRRTRNAVVVTDNGGCRVEPSRRWSAADASDGEGDFIDETLAIWQKRANRQLAREDGREIIENMSGFFRILQEWDRIDRAAKRPRKRLAD